ncbi:MAG: ABC transporter ATP-binding protein [Candidatus Pacebacteria bacterium]|nr:ABC transporter ATP-binding protein [Candidatus Paceibacterota bacterium]
MVTDIKQKNTYFSWLDVSKSIWYFLEEDKKKFIFAFIVLTLGFFYDLVPIYVVGKIVDFFSTYQAGDSLRTFYLLIIFLSVSWTLVLMTRDRMRTVIQIIGENARTKARTYGFQRLTEFSLEWHQKENTGNKLQRIFTGSDSITRWMRILRSDLIKIFADIVGAAVFFAFTDYKFILVVLFYAIIYLYVEFYFSNKLMALSDEFNTHNQNAGGTYIESANNMLAIKALGSEKGAIARVAEREKLSRDTAAKKVRVQTSQWKLLHILMGLSLLLFLYFIGLSVLSGQITIGLVLVLFTYFSKLQSSLANVSSKHMEIIDLRSDLGNMMPIFKETELIKTGNNSFPKNWDKIEIKNAVMDYGSGQMGLKDFSLTLERGTKTGVAGLSGSGKSTLAKIILGLYALKEGKFKVGNQSYYNISHNETLNNITVVLQETELFNLSLKDNITMMRGEDIELLNQAIEISQLKEVINKLPDGLNSMVGEKGYMLSGGERQRLGIARAIYKNSPIIILDEATSSLDSETEGKVMEKLLGAYGKGKTFLIIAHRLGTLKYTDNIAVMEDGRVLEEGNYDELMNNKDSIFCRMNSVRIREGLERASASNGMNKVQKKKDGN